MLTANGSRKVELVDPTSSSTQNDEAISIRDSIFNTMTGGIVSGVK